MSLWIVIPVLIVACFYCFSAGFARGKNEILERIERERNEASKLLDSDKAAVLALLYEAKDRAYDSETQVFSEEWEGALKSIDELRYLWRFKEPVQWVNRYGTMSED